VGRNLQIFKGIVPQVLEPLLLIAVEESFA
jgi:hypothetical protein